MTEIIGIALAIITAIFIGYPLLQKQRGKVSFALNHRAQEMEARKKEIYAAIRDIDFDYQMGKLSKDDYEALRQQYKTEAIGMMKQLDQSVVGPSLRRARTAGAVKNSERFCHHCGQPVGPEDQFCGACGGKLT
jgi:hypothetical protein